MTSPVILVPLLAVPFFAPAIQEPVAASKQAQTAPTEPLLLDQGPDLPKLRIPRSERLVFRARVSAIGIQAEVGTVTITSGVEPYKPSLILPVPGQSRDQKAETGWIKAHAEGGNAFYTLDALIETRFLPQDWPRLVYTYDHKGSERRMREILVGERDGQPMASYRGSTTNGAPKGQIIWHKASLRQIPSEYALDTVGAIYLGRTMVVEGIEELEFQMLNKLKLWNVKISQGERRVIETHAGKFEAVQIELESTYHEDNPPKDDDERFEGLFGIHGTMNVWVEAKTGVPLWVEGVVPLGPIDIVCDIRLSHYGGTPEGFVPAPDAEPAGARTDKAPGGR